VIREITRRSEERRTLYDVLQVSQQADEAVLQAAYRALARANHPDLNPDAAASQRMRELNEAYELLSNPRRRAVYDLSLNQERATARAASDEPGQMRRRTACWQCDDPLEGAFARYCGECHWIICEACRSCGCSHPSWQRRLGSERAQVVLLIGWILSGLLALGWLTCAFGAAIRGLGVGG
jgi:DnaJ-domain-containing protein 1